MEQVRSADFCGDFLKSNFCDGEEISKFKYLVATSPEMCQKFRQIKIQEKAKKKQLNIEIST